MRKIISLVLALCLALGCAAFAEGTLPAICDAEYTMTVDGTDALIVADAENVTFDITEDVLSQAVAAGLETVTFKAGAIKTTIKLASMLEQGTHFNIVLNNNAEMNEGEAKAAAGVAKSSARLGFMLVNEDGTLTDLSDKLEGSITLYVAWDGVTGSIRAITNNGSGYQRTQMNCVKGYEDGMTTVTCYRLISASYITLNGYEFIITGLPADGSDISAVIPSGNNKRYEIHYDFSGLPKGESLNIYFKESDKEGYYFPVNNGSKSVFRIKKSFFRYDKSIGKWYYTMVYTIEYEGVKYSKKYTYYSDTDPNPIS